jgi:hypothetical protein
MLTTWGARYLGGELTPAVLNSWLRIHNGYYHDNLVIFQAIEPLGATMVKLITCPSTPAPVGILNNYLSSGDYAVIVKVDAAPGGTVQPHYVLADHTYISMPDAKLMDPWRAPGAPPVNMGYYCPAGWTAVRAILQAVVYKLAVKDASVTLAADVQAFEHQEELCPRLDGVDSEQGFTSVTVS